MTVEQPLEKKANESFRPELPTAQTSEPVQVLGMYLFARSGAVTCLWSFYLILVHLEFFNSVSFKYG